jgi:predicted alpha/beta-fold hydrolase
VNSAHAAGAVPLLAINAKDDPIVHKNPLDCGLNPYVALAITKQGGHLGWFKDGMSARTHDIMIVVDSQRRWYTLGC